MREQIIIGHGDKCDKCGIQRNQAKNKYGRDLHALKSGEVLCKACFQKRNREKTKENRMVGAR